MLNIALISPVTLPLILFITSCLAWAATTMLGIRYIRANRPETDEHADDCLVYELELQEVPTIELAHLTKLCPN